MTHAHTGQRARPTLAAPLAAALLAAPWLAMPRPAAAQTPAPVTASPLAPPPQYAPPAYPAPAAPAPQPAAPQAPAAPPAAAPTPGAPTPGAPTPGAPTLGAPTLGAPTLGAPAPAAPAPAGAASSGPAVRPNIWLPQGAALLQGLDKVNAQSATLTVKVGQAGTFGSLTINVQACVARPPDQPADAAAYLVITDAHADAPGFKGWMLRSEPAASMLEHPVYDVRLISCAP